MSDCITTYAPIFELNGIDDKLPSTTRKTHIRRLNDILHLSVERGDITRARRAWALLARCKEFDWKTKWRTGLLLLSDTHEAASESRSVDFLKKLMRHCPDEQESILQEITLHLANLGKYRESLDELDLYLPSFPFQENPVLLSYAGLMSLKLALSSSDDISQPLGDMNMLREAQKHFKRALDIDPDSNIAKAFMEEITHQLSRSEVAVSQPLDDAQSEEEMEIDSKNPSTLSKRMKRASDGV